MPAKHPQEWESRREIPNPQIKDVADQYEQARSILSKCPPGTGVSLPLMNAAAMAIELYLKCLAGEVVHVVDAEDPSTGMPEIDGIKSEKVFAQASMRGHNFRKLLVSIDEDIRSLLDANYVDETGNQLACDLTAVDEALVMTRYPFEPNMDLERIDFKKTLMTVSKFLGSFVANLEPRETIQWKDGSVSLVEHM